MNNNKCNELCQTIHRAKCLYNYVVDLSISNTLNKTTTAATTCNKVANTTDSHTGSGDHTYCKITGNVEATDVNKMTIVADTMDTVTADTTDNNEHDKNTDTPDEASSTSDVVDRAFDLVNRVSNMIHMASNIFDIAYDMVDRASDMDDRASDMVNRVADMVDRASAIFDLAYVWFDVAYDMVDSAFEIVDGTSSGVYNRRVVF